MRAGGRAGAVGTRGVTNGGEGGVGAGERAARAYLILEQHAHGSIEGRWWDGLLDDLGGHEVAVEVDATDELDDEIVIVDWLAGAVQCVSHLLQAGVLPGGRRIALANITLRYTW